ncbi:MAG: ABC transporter ATP-binding protein [Trueperaceae bacterium]
MNLELSQLCINIEAKRIVQEVNLNVSPGKIVGLIGPNGSGKSTLLRSVYRMLRPVSGLVKLGDDNVWQLSAKTSAQRTGVVVQEHPSEFEFTVAEVVAMGRTPHKKPFERDTAKDLGVCHEALERVNMTSFSERLFSTLSGGEKQRVLVARALAQEPKLLVLDEPTNHLDIHYQLELLELVKSLGITTLLTLHDLNLAANYCQRLYLLSNGQIAASGKTQDVLTPEQLRETFKVEATPYIHPITGNLQLSFAPLQNLNAHSKSAKEVA